MGIDHGIISTVILLFCLLKKGRFQLLAKVLSYQGHNSKTQGIKPGLGGSDAPSDWRSGGHGFNPHRDRQYSFVEIDHEIFSMVFLSFPLIQEGQLSVSGKRMCTILVNRLED